MEIVSGDKSATSIKSTYIASTSYSFSIEVEFGKEPVGLFKLRIRVNSNLAQKYFSGIDISREITLDINPAYLARVRTNEDDILA